jgi:hypothetical protein
MSEKITSTRLKDNFSMKEEIQEEKEMSRRPLKKNPESTRRKFKTRRSSRLHYSIEETLVKATKE